MYRTILATLVTTSCLVLFLLVPGAEAQTLENPLASGLDSIPNFIAGALKVMVMIALPIITLFFVYSGFLFISAQGNDEGLSRAKNNFLYTVIGAALILGAWVLSTMIAGTVTQLTKG